MPKLVPRPVKDTYEPPPTPARSIVRAAPTPPKVKIPPLVLNLGNRNIPDTIGFSCALRDGKWKIVDRYSRILPEQPVFSDDAVARAYADALNDHVTRRRFGG